MHTMIDREKMLAELIEIYKRIGYSTKASVDRALRHLQKATV